ncbi:MAG: hypothetical protein M1834_002659 [Cirrosporium novae-zelandiae]|nr:MAG: hypothetical protein M1834_002659 [Cirrosporium novae-zelandiae]
MEEHSLERVMRTPTRSSKSRSMSDTPKPTLSPSPAFLESARGSKDDIGISTLSVLTTPKKQEFPFKGLSLQMPNRDVNVTTPTSASLSTVGPLSPKVDVTSPYGSPASVLPRHSRGLDFSRACTNLHHSTLADQSSPESSPVLSGRGMSIPKRKSMSSILGAIDPVGISGHPLWSAHPNVERTGFSSSVGSITMLDSDSTTTDSSEDEPMDQTDNDDPMLSTPQAMRRGNRSQNPFLTGSGLQSPGNYWLGGTNSPAPSSFLTLRARLHHRQSRKSSSSASGSGHSSMHSPAPLSPTALKGLDNSSGYFGREANKKGFESRRESLSLGANDMNLSDGEGSDGSPSLLPSRGSGLGVTIGSVGAEERRGVIRRAVTRRTNMMPKSKGFTRIQAQLIEESAPIEYEAKREAEVIHQVLESDRPEDKARHPSLPTTAGSSPTLLPGLPLQESLEDIPEDDMVSNASGRERRQSSAFSHQAMKNSGGREFWDSMEENMRTPPPASFGRGSSVGTSEDVNMDTPPTARAFHQLHSTSRSRSSTPQPLVQPTPSGITTAVRKRRREDDFDIETFKRRAVSPGMSLQNSPVLPQSPAAREGSIWWGKNGDRHNNNTGLTGTIGTPKRVGLQGMNDTNDGLMNMSIE